MRPTPQTQISLSLLGDLGDLGVKISFSIPRFNRVQEAPRSPINWPRNKPARLRLTAPQPAQTQPAALPEQLPEKADTAAPARSDRRSPDAARPRSPAALPFPPAAAAPVARTPPRMCRTPAGRYRT